MSVFRYTEDGGYAEDFDTADRDAAVAYARHMLRSADWPDNPDKTMFVHATVTELDAGGQPAGWHSKVTVTLHPVEPPCAGTAEHAWDGGTDLPGEAIRHTCVTCGVARVADPGGTDPADGSVQATIAYERPPQAGEPASAATAPPAPVPAAEVALWYSRHHSSGFWVLEETDAARKASGIMFRAGEDGVILGVQYPDGRAVPPEEWPAYQDAQAAYLTARPAPDPWPPGRQVRDPFTRQIVSVPDDTPGWVGRPVTGDASRGT